MIDRSIVVVQVEYSSHSEIKLRLSFMRRDVQYIIKKKFAIVIAVHGSLHHMILI